MSTSPVISTDNRPNQLCSTSTHEAAEPYDFSLANREVDAVDTGSSDSLGVENDLTGICRAPRLQVSF